MEKTFVLGVHRHMHREVVPNFALDLSYSHGLTSDLNNDSEFSSTSRNLYIRKWIALKKARNSN